jgi:voltage-gated potassium channel Kch
MNTSDLQKQIKRFTLRNLNLFLLIGIFGLFFISPALESKTGKEFPETIFFTIIFLAAVVAVKAGNNRLLIAAVFFSAYIWFDLLFLGDNTRYNLTFFLLIIYFVYIVIRLIFKIIKTENVTPDVIMEAINIYLLIGIVGALIFGIINHFIPGSIPEISSDTRHFNDYLYFSFVTLTTLGYGDISPVKQLAQSFAVTLAITGQFYITIVMAFLVSKFITSNTKEN